jgi:hypothetical protein
MQLDRLKRREFIAVVGGAAAWPLAAGAQQVSGVPRIGYLSPGSASSGPLNYYDEFRRELRELGYIEGQNIVIDYRFADGKFDRLPQLFGVRGPDEFDRTFAAITSANAATLLVLPDPVFSAYTARIADLANKSQLPTMYGLREDALAGGLMAYGPNYADLYRRAASYVNKILKGAKPADLPVERPTNFEFVINLKTTKLLGIELPPTVLALADEVIE